MDTHIILEAAHASVTGKLPFPEIIKKLIETGVEYYHVDYVSRMNRFYGPAGDIVEVPLLLEKLPPVSPAFDEANLKAAILDSQKSLQNYQSFSERAMKAGVQGYFAFLHGKRVTYLGRDGNHHTEWFPGAKS